MPTLFLTNWSKSRTPGFSGPGRRFTIMAKPRHWERGDGRVVVCSPLGSYLRPLMEAAVAARGDVATMQTYLDAFDAHLLAGAALLRPHGTGRDTGYYLDASPYPIGIAIPVADGDTLCCACAVAEARAGRCHRAWVAPHLVRAGWNVVLDGVPFVLPEDS